MLDFRSRPSQTSSFPTRTSLIPQCSWVPSQVEFNMAPVTYLYTPDVEWDGEEREVKLWCETNKAWSTHRSSGASMAHQSYLQMDQNDSAFLPPLWSVIGCGLCSRVFWAKALSSAEGNLAGADCWLTSDKLFLKETSGQNISCPQESTFCATLLHSLWMFGEWLP